MPKLPPSVNEKDQEHAHSNIMPVGIQPEDGGGKFILNVRQLI